VSDFLDRVREHGRDFFTNWSGSELPVAKRLGVTARNRVKALVTGCCGNHGQPGC
jgi:hypothetical protein